MTDVIISEASDMNELTDLAIEHLRELKMVQVGDAVVIMAGSQRGGAATTDTVRMAIVS